MNMEKKVFEFLPLRGGAAIPVNKKRMLIGRSRCCDIVIRHPDVSAIHAAIEVCDGGAVIYDMNSSNGTFYKGKQIVKNNISVGDTISFGKNEYTFKNFSKEDVPELPLKILESILPPEIASSRELPRKGLPLNQQAGVFHYPLAKDPRADYTEYIFEDTDELYPIFSYTIERKSIEVIILFNDEIFSIDYLPLRNGIYRLAGSDPNRRDIVLATIPQKGTEDFISIVNGDVFVECPSGYEQLSMKRTTMSNSSLLDSDDLFRLERGSISIYIRGSEAPPFVKHPKVFKIDRELKKYLALTLVIAAAFLISMSLFEVDREMEKEKIPERIATILYKKKIEIKKVEPKVKPKKIAPIKKKIVVKPKIKTKEKVIVVKSSRPVKEKIKKIKKAGQKNALKSGVLKKASSKQVDRKSRNVIVMKKRAAFKKSLSKKRARRTVITPLKKKGHVDTYVSTDFSNTISSFLSKGLKMKNAKVIDDNPVDMGDLLLDNSASSKTMKRARIKQNVGSLTGAASGKLDSAKGLDGIESRKRSVYMDVPIATVTLSSMDPEVVRSILLDYLPQFKFCYQKVLEKTSKGFDGVLTLEFVIGATGHVVNAGLGAGSSSIPSRVKGCVINVLRGIRFPGPLGGGKVGVKQPLNFRINY